MFKMKPALFIISILALFGGVLVRCNPTRGNTTRPQRNEMYCEGDYLKEEVWRHRDDILFNSRHQECFSPERAGCWTRISCSAPNPEDRCAMLSWMVFNSIFWHHPAAIYDERERVTVLYFTVRITEISSMDTREANLEIEINTLDKVLPSLQRFLRQNPNFQTISMRAGIHNCSYWTSQPNNYSVLENSEHYTPPQNFSSCNIDNINETFWRLDLHNPTVFPESITGCERYNRGDDCRMSLVCTTLKPLREENRCFLLMWMIYQTFFWPGPALIRDEMKNVTVHFIMYIKEFNATMRRIRLPMNTVDQVLLSVQRIVRQFPNIQVAQMQTIIEFCDIWDRTSEGYSYYDEHKYPPPLPMVGLSVYYKNVLSQDVCHKRWNISCTANCRSGEVDWKHPFGIPMCNSTLMKCCRAEGSFDTAVIPKATSTNDANRNVNITWNSDSCGRSSSSPATHRTKRVFGGTVSTPSQWPWVVNFVDWFQVEECNGALILPQWVLTVRHCVRYMLISTAFFRVRVGQHDRGRPDANEREHEIDAIYVHPGYYESKSHYINNDIALIKLKVPAQNVEPVCLPSNTTNFDFTQAACWLTGWGRYEGSGWNESRRLRQAQVPHVDMEECIARHRSHGNSTTIPQPDTKLCFGNGTLSACHGDFGAPLVCRSGNGRYVLQGLASYGDPNCSSKTTPDIFPKISYYMPWIKQTIEENLYPKGHPYTEMQYEVMTREVGEDN